MKIITAHIYKPHLAVFKSMKNDRAECQAVNCEGFEKCGLYARGECCWLGSLGWNRCPYGSYNKEVGMTRKSSKYYSWISEREKRYADVLDKLRSASDVMAIVGDFIYLPYAHMTMNENIPFQEKSGFFLKGDCLLPRADFTIKNITSMCLFRPQAIFGGEITSYQIEQVPKFIKHLSEIMPEMYKELCEALPELKKVSLSNVGRKAYLFTLSPNAGKFVDCHGGEWLWDGTYLTSNNSKASFMLVGKFTELRIKPDDNPVVTITDENQVNDKTEFYRS